MANYDTNIPVFEDLKEYLHDDRRGKIRSGGRQVVIRCPWCGDSRDFTDAHLYIGPSRKYSKALSYYCFLCGRGGALDQEFFRMIDCYDINLIGRVLDYNAEQFKNSKYDRQGFVTERVTKPRITNKQEDLGMSEYDKLAYVNNRLGVNLTLEDLSRLKIVTNLRQYIKDNHVRGISRKKEILDELSHKFVGFLSVDNTYMVMRAVADPATLHPEIGMRYVNYQLTFDRFWCYTYYTIPVMIDITKEVHLHIAEGCFDILGVYFHCDRSNRTGNEIFTACSGRTFYLDVLKYFIMKAMIPGCLMTVDMYLDKEKDGSVKIDEKMQTMITTIRSLVKSVKIHINAFEGEKDFGVTPDKIIDNVIYSIE